MIDRALAVACRALVYAALVALLLAFALEAASAQQTSVGDVIPGSLVRVTAPDHGLERAVGTVQEIADGSLRIEFVNPRIYGGPPPQERLDLTIARSDIEALDLGTGRERNVGKGMLIGFSAGSLVGAAIGMMIGADSPEPCEGLFCNAFRTSASEKAVILGVGLGLGGTAAGAIIGMRRTDRWSPIIESGASVSLMPTSSGGMAVAATVRF